MALNVLEWICIIIREGYQSADNMKSDAFTKLVRKIIKKIFELNNSISAMKKWSVSMWKKTADGQLVTYKFKHLYKGNPSCLACNLLKVKFI